MGIGVLYVQDLAGGRHVTRNTLIGWNTKLLLHSHTHTHTHAHTHTRTHTHTHTHLLVIFAFNWLLTVSDRKRSGESVTNDIQPRSSNSEAPCGFQALMMDSGWEPFWSVIPYFSPQ